MTFYGIAVTAALLVLFVSMAMARQVTIHNNIPRRDVAGNIIDCHSGMILPVNGVFYMYGEHYGNTTGFGPSPPLLYPKIVVYTSTDFVSWSFGGFVLDEWPTKPYGTFFTPWVIFQKRTDTFVMYFNAYFNGCCNGNWASATSKDGIHFTLANSNVQPTFPLVDGNALFVDDDGAAYSFYSSLSEDHRESIETLDTNWTNVVGAEGNLGLFPDHYVEGGVLFKRNGTYYAGYGSCCCFCRGGSGWVVYSSKSLKGPWVRQSFDLNCNSTAPDDVCGAYGERPNDPVVIHAQGIGMSMIPLKDGSTAFIWQGERWLSAAHNNASCPNECQPCEEPANYIKGHGFSYWLPLTFNPDGSIAPFGSFVDHFTLDVAEDFGVDHLPGPLGV
jgi:hypothetical protein